MCSAPTGEDPATSWASMLCKSVDPPRSGGHGTSCPDPPTATGLPDVGHGGGSTLTQTLSNTL